MVFDQVFPNGTTNSSLGAPYVSQNLVQSSFPSFSVAPLPDLDLGFLAYNGDMVGSDAYQVRRRPAVAGDMHAMICHSLAAADSHAYV